MFLSPTCYRWLNPKYVCVCVNGKVMFHEQKPCVLQNIVCLLKCFFSEHKEPQRPWSHGWWTVGGGAMDQRRWKKGWLLLLFQWERWTINLRSSSLAHALTAPPLLHRVLSYHFSFSPPQSSFWEDLHCLIFLQCYRFLFSTMSRSFPTFCALHSSLTTLLVR